MSDQVQEAVQFMYSGQLENIYKVKHVEIAVYITVAIAPSHLLC
jgi:hypothetical protein